MIFGRHTDDKFYFNGDKIDVVDQYKYLGNIFQRTRTCREDMFGKNYAYLVDKARKAAFAMIRKTKLFMPLPADGTLHLFNSLVLPILQYGSEIWGVNNKAWQQIDRMCLRFMRGMLGIKHSSPNVITFGECGITPPSVKCQISVLCYFNRLENLPDSMLVKQVFNELRYLHNHGFMTSWYTKACELQAKFGLNLNPNIAHFKAECRRSVSNYHIRNWSDNLHNSNEQSMLRFYKIFKQDYKLEQYLSDVQNYKYRNAIAKFRCSSHSLEIEKGRHAKPKIPVQERLCKSCHVLDDEFHLLFSCKIHSNEREVLFSNIVDELPTFNMLDCTGKLKMLLTSDSTKVLTLLGKFLFKSFEARKWLQHDKQ